METTVLQMILESRVPTGLGGRWYGVYPALVTDIKDPDGQGRVKVTLPWAPDTGSGRYEAWARVATLMGGKNRGTWFIPDEKDEVLLAFEDGNPDRPYVLGGLWNGADSAPQLMDRDGKNNLKVLRSRNGVKVTLDDSDGKEKLILETPGGQKITMKDDAGSVEIVDSNDNSVKLETSGITVNTSAKVTINASQVAISAALVTVDAGTSKFSGVVRAPAFESDSVISKSYTPGAGNIW